MSFAIQNIIALSLVGGAAAYLVRQLVLAWRSSHETSCGSHCAGGCHTPRNERVPLVSLTIPKRVSESNNSPAQTDSLK